MNREIFQYKNIFTPMELSLIINTAEILPLRLTGYGQRIAWVEHNDATGWIFDAILPHLYCAASENGLTISRLERLQFSRYKEGGHLPWHVDHLETTPPEAKDRVINGVLQLSDPENYTGGDLQIYKGDVEKCKDFPDGEIVTADRDRGNLTIIPGDLWHRVQPITRGIRKSLVFWGLK